jgi:hypothetical protein
VKPTRNKLDKTPTTRIKQKLQEALAKLILRLQVHDTFFGEKVLKNQLKHIFMGQSSRNKSHLITFRIVGTYVNQSSFVGVASLAFGLHCPTFRSHPKFCLILCETSKALLLQQIKYLQ